MTPIEIYLVGYVLALITLVLGTIYIEKEDFTTKLLFPTILVSVFSYIIFFVTIIVVLKEKQVGSKIQKSYKKYFNDNIVIIKARK